MFVQFGTYSNLLIKIVLSPATRGELNWAIVPEQWNSLVWSNVSTDKNKTNKQKKNNNKEKTEDWHENIARVGDMDQP